MAHRAAQQPAWIGNQTRSPSVRTHLGRAFGHGIGLAGRLGRQQLARIGVLRVAAKTCAVGPCSTISPPCITQTRSAMRRTIPGHG
jgi:hypothetical protein